MTVEPPPYQLGPRCPHGEPMALACPQCADPLTVAPEDRPSVVDALRRRFPDGMPRSDSPAARFVRGELTIEQVRAIWALEDSQRRAQAEGWLPDDCPTPSEALIEAGRLISALRAIVWAQDAELAILRRPSRARRLWRLLTTPIRPRRPGWDRRETR